MTPFIQFVVLVAASIVSGAALYVARKVSDISEKIDENEQRSRQNEQYLMGDPPSGRSVIDRLRNLEDRNQ